MTNGALDAELLENLQQALADFYDPPRLLDNPLVTQLGLAHRANPAAAFQALLAKAIQALRPGDDVPRHAPVHRYYLLLHQRFVEQFTQKEVAADLGLSVRQLRRQEKPALDLLAAQILRSHVPHTGQQGKQAPGAAATGSATPSREEELAWTQKTFPDDAVVFGPLLASVLQIAAPLLQSLRVEVTVDLPDLLPSLAGPPVSIRQALLNVLTSIARRTPDAHLRLRAEVRALAVAVRISAPLNQDLSALAAAGDSENLRMATDLLDPAGGRVQFVVDEERFIVELYLPSERQITVMAVDDNPDTLRLLGRYVADTHYHLVGVAEADRVLATARSLRPEIIVLDVMMPQIDGWELLGTLRAHPDLSSSAILVCTILPQEPLARSLGAAGFLRKPVSRSDFLAALDAQVALLR